jgi:hypothetical protein
MTDQRHPSEPGRDTDEILRDADRRPATPGPDDASPDAKPEQEPNPLLRDGADAPDAADIEDPDEQL